MFRTLCLLTLASCWPLLYGEVVVVDGEDYLLIPAELLDNNRHGHNSLYWSKPYELNDTGHLEVSEVYRRVYQFSDDDLQIINDSLRQLEMAYFQHLHQNCKMEKDVNNIMTITISSSMDKMKDAQATYRDTVKKLLSEKQQAALKYFDLFDFSSRSSNRPLIPSDNMTYTVVLTPPVSEQPFAKNDNDENKKNIAELQEKIDAVKVEMNNGADKAQEFMKLHRELRKLQRHNANPDSYTIEYRSDSGSGSSSNSQKPKSFQFYERAFRFHLDGTFE